MSSLRQVVILGVESTYFLQRHSVRPIIFSTGELKANQIPLVYLPSINTTGSTQIINRRHEHLLARLDSDITIDAVTGSELTGNGEGEVFRISSISLVEIV